MQGVLSEGRYGPVTTPSNARSSLAVISTPGEVRVSAGQPAARAARSNMARAEATVRAAVASPSADLSAPSLQTSAARRGLGSRSPGSARTPLAVSAG